MCDCYSERCHGSECERWMEIHIADFCVDQDKVHPYCPDCAQKLAQLDGRLSSLLEALPGQAELVGSDHFVVIGDRKWFADRVYRDEKGEEQVEGAEAGEAVLIAVDDLDAYGVALN